MCPDPCVSLKAGAGPWNMIFLKSVFLSLLVSRVGQDGTTTGRFVEIRSVHLRQDLTFPRQYYAMTVVFNTSITSPVGNGCLLMVHGPEVVRFLGHRQLVRHVGTWEQQGTEA